MNSNIRQHALRLLRSHENETPSVIHNAIIDLRRNAERGDVKVLRQFLDHYDPMVVAATLYTLCEVHNQRAALKTLLENIADNGDFRESQDLDKPIQCMAIELLASLGKHDDVAVAKIIQVADNCNAPDPVRALAWERLAQLFDAEWPRNATEELLLRPESETSIQLRNCIRNMVCGLN